MTKELWCAWHEELTEEILEENPDMPEQEAFKLAEDRMDKYYADRMGDLIDRARAQRKEE